MITPAQTEYKLRLKGKNMKKLVLISLLAMGSGVAGCCGDGSGDHAGHSNALNTAGVASTGSGDRAASSNALDAAGAASTGSGDRAASSNASGAAGAASTASGAHAGHSSAGASTGSGVHAGHAIALSTAGAASIAGENEGKWIWNGQGHKKLQTLRSKDGFAVLSFKLPKSEDFSYFEISLIQSEVNEYTISTTDKDSYGKLLSPTLKVAAPTDELQTSLPRLQGLHVERKKELNEIKGILKSSIEYVWIDEEGQEHKFGAQEVTKHLNTHAPGDEFLPHYQGGDKPYWIVTTKANSVGKYGWQITEQIEHSNVHNAKVVEEVVDTSHDIEQIYHVTKLSPPSSLSSSWVDAGSAPLDQRHTDGALSSEHDQTQTRVEVSEKDGKIIRKTITHTTHTTTMSGERQMMVAQSQHEAHVSTIASDAHSEQSEVFVEQESPPQSPLTRNRKKQTNKNRQ